MSPMPLALFLVAAAVLAASARWLISANPTARIPYLTSPPATPRGAIWLRALGTGTAIVCAVVADLPAFWWAAVVVLVAWIPAITMLLWHNARVRPPAAGAARSGNAPR